MTLCCNQNETAASAECGLRMDDGSMADQTTVKLSSLNDRRRGRGRGAPLTSLWNLGLGRTGEKTVEKQSSAVVRESVPQDKSSNELLKQLTPQLFNGGTVPECATSYSVFESFENNTA